MSTSLKSLTMEMIRKIFYSASLGKRAAVRAFCQMHKKELTVISLFLVLGSATYINYSSSFLVKNIATIYNLSIDSHKKINLAPSERFNIQNIISKTMSYSYTDTQLGFFLQDLDFFDSVSKTEAETMILKSLPRSLAKNAGKYVRAVLVISEKHQVDPIWILSVMWTESHFDFSAKSWAGARGLMQIMPATRKFLYKQYKSQGNSLLVEQSDFNINEYFPYRVRPVEIPNHVLKIANIELGVIYLKKLLNSFKSHKYATVAYNMGPGWTRGRLRRNLPVGQKNEYLDKVRKAYKRIVKKI